MKRGNNNYSGKSPGRIRAWIEAMRLRTLPVSMAGVIVGCGSAAFYSSFRIIPAVICLIFAVVAQIASNFANEYFDYKNGFDKKGREGFRRGVTEGDLSPIAMKRATFMLLILDCILGLSLVWFGGIWLILVGIFVAIFAIAYSAGPYPLSHHGLGEIAVIIFFGFVPVVFTCYVQTGIFSWDSASVPLSVSVGLLAANVLIVNNVRDKEDDSMVGKRTLAVIFGIRTMQIVYLIFSLAALIIPVVVLSHNLPSTWLYAVGLLMLIQSFIWYRLWKDRGRLLNKVLGMTAMFLLLFSIILCVALCTNPLM